MTPLTARLSFFGKFVVVAAVLFASWKSGLASAYAYAVLISVTVLSPFLTGYQVTIGTGAHGITASFEAGGARVEVPFVLHEALAGLVPFLALMCASSGQTLLQWMQRSAAGVAVLYVAHVLVLILSPLLVTPHERWLNRLIDVTYGFYAVAGFVGLPFALWMILTRPWANLPSARSRPAPAAGRDGDPTPSRGTTSKRR